MATGSNGGFCGRIRRGKPKLKRLEFDQRRAEQPVQRRVALSAISTVVAAVLGSFAAMVAGCADQPLEQPVAAPLAQPPAAEPTGPPSVSVRELCEAYAQDLAAADEQYLHERIELTGELVQKGTDLNKHFLYVGAESFSRSDGPASTRTVRCEFPQSAYDKLVTLDAGRYVRVTGRVAGKVEGTITLLDCDL
jgi:hypothetical protein